MAVWQFKVAFIPRDWIDSGGEIADLFGEDCFDPSQAWVTYNDAHVEASFGTILPLGKSWHHDLSFWGNVTTDDIQLFRSEGRIESLYVRFDLRNPNVLLFQSITRVAQELRLAVVSLRTRRVIPPDAKQLMRCAAESEAAHFVMDPEGFLLQVTTANDKAT